MSRRSLLVALVLLLACDARAQPGPVIASAAGGWYMTLPSPLWRVSASEPDGTVTFRGRDGAQAVVMRATQATPGMFDDLRAQHPEAAFAFNGVKGALSADIEEGPPQMTKAICSITDGAQCWVVTVLARSELVEGMQGDRVAFVKGFHAGAPPAGTPSFTPEEAAKSVPAAPKPGPAPVLEGANVRAADGDFHLTLPTADWKLSPGHHRAGEVQLDATDGVNATVVAIPADYTPRGMARVLMGSLQAKAARFKSDWTEDPVAESKTGDATVTIYGAESKKGGIKAFVATVARGARGFMVTCIAPPQLLDARRAELSKLAQSVR